MFSDMKVVHISTLPEFNFKQVGPIDISFCSEQIGGSKAQYAFLILLPSPDCCRAATDCVASSETATRLRGR